MQPFWRWSGKLSCTPCKQSVQHLPPVGCGLSNEALLSHQTAWVSGWSCTNCSHTCCAWCAHPCFLLEAVMPLGSIDQPLLRASFGIWGSIDSIFLFTSAPFVLLLLVGFSSTSTFSIFSRKKKSDSVLSRDCFCRLVGHLHNRCVARLQLWRGSTIFVALLALGCSTGKEGSQGSCGAALQVC